MAENKSLIDQLVTILTGINSVASAANPLVGLSAAAVRIIVRLMKDRGEDVGTLEAELAKLEAVEAEIMANDAKWRAEHPESAPPK